MNDTDCNITLEADFGTVRLECRGERDITMITRKTNTGVVNVREIPPDHPANQELIRALTQVAAVAAAASAVIWPREPTNAERDAVRPLVPGGN
jgi:hypothetical protein